MEDQETPTMKDVQADEARVNDLKARLEEQEAHLQATEQKIRAVYRSGEGDADALAPEMAATKARVEGLQGAIEDLEKKIEEDRAAALKGQAARRLDPGLKRAVGSLVAEYEKDEKKVIEGANALVQAIERLHARRKKVARLRIEADCLRARWPDLPEVDLPPVPRVSEDVLEALLEVRSAAKVDSSLPKSFAVFHNASADAEERRRNILKALKTFVDREQLDPESETARILREAGIPEPEPTEREVEIAREREAQRKRAQREMARYAGEAKALSSMRVNPLR